jgi:hypothetical protein
VDEDITFLTVFDQRWTRTRITRDDHRAIRRLESVAKRQRPFTMPDRKRRNRDICILKNHTGANVFRLDF